MFPQLGPAIAFALSSATFLITGLVMGDTDEAFLAYGWRIPFLLSILLVGVGLYVRLNIEETPAFKAAQQAAQQAARSAAQKAAQQGDRERPDRLPFLAVMTSQPREVLLAAGAVTMMFAFFYMGTAYLTAYGSTNPDGPMLPRPVVLGIGIGAAVVFGIVIAVAGVLSDRFGRRKVIMTSCAVGIGWTLVLFPLLDTGTPLAFGIGLTVTMVIFAVSYGPAGSFLPELFTARHRYTGAGLAYNLAGILGGAIPPLLATGLAASFGSIAIGVMLSLLAVLSLVCTFALHETLGRSLEHEREPDDVVPA